MRVDREDRSQRVTVERCRGQRCIAAAIEPVGEQVHAGGQAQRAAFTGRPQVVGVAPRSADVIDRLEGLLVAVEFHPRLERHSRLDAGVHAMVAVLKRAVTRQMNHARRVDPMAEPYGPGDLVDMVLADVAVLAAEGLQQRGRHDRRDDDPFHAVAAERPTQGMPRLVGLFRCQQQRIILILCFHFVRSG